MLLNYSCPLDKGKLEKAMATHSSTLAWRIPWMEEPGRVWSMGLWRVWHDWVTSLSLFTFTNWRRKWQPTPVFLPGKSQGRWSLVSCCLWGRRVGHKWRDLAAAAAEQINSHIYLRSACMNEAVYYILYIAKIPDVSVYFWCNIYVLSTLILYY